MSRTLKDALTESNPNKVAAVLHALRAGAAFAAIPQFVQAAVSSDTLELPETLRAAVVLKAYSRTGGAAQELTPVPQGTTPAAGEVSVDAVGNIVFAAADAVTAAEVLYVPFQGEIFEDLVTVAASAALFNSSRRGVLLLEAEVITGVIPGDKTVDFRGAAVAAGEVVITDAGTGLAFNAADVVAGTARVKYVAAPGVGHGTSDPLSTLLTELQAAL